MSEWEVVIGLELHVQLSTQSKLFSGASASFGADPNTQACAVDLGLPGVLPVVNEAVFEKAVAFGLGIGASIGKRSIFDRKNYFYPDLPKGYQITQMFAPILEGGSVEIEVDGGTRTINVTRAHLEEDAGKSLHELPQGELAGLSGIDLNRAGTPLLEIVSEPELRSASEAAAYARAVHGLVTYLGISDGDMSQGSLRCDANVSLRRPGDKELGTRTEIKNVNSFRFLERAIEYEAERQARILEAGKKVEQETRQYDPVRDETRPMRSKETAMDYRYFPEPDLLPVELTDAFIDKVRDAMPELPTEKRARYASELGLGDSDARLLSADLGLANYFETAAQTCGDVKLAANWVKGDLLASLHRDEIGIAECPVPAATLGALLGRITDGTLSGTMAKTVFAALWQGEATEVDAYIEAQGLRQVTDAGSIEPIIDKVLTDNPTEVEQYRGGKTKLLGFFVGQVMKETSGKGDPKRINELLREKLG